MGKEGYGVAKVWLKGRDGMPGRWGLGLPEVGYLTIVRYRIGMTPPFAIRCNTPLSLFHEPRLRPYTRLAVTMWWRY